MKIKFTIFKKTTVQTCDTRIWYFSTPFPKTILTIPNTLNHHHTIFIPIKVLYATLINSALFIEVLKNGLS